MEEEQTPPKKAVAKRATKKEPNQSEQMMLWLIKNPIDKICRVVLKKHYNLPVQTSCHPRKAEDVENLLILLSACGWIDIKCMKGYCKLWDAELNGLLARFEKPYQNGPQNNFQDALYGE